MFDLHCHILAGIDDGANSIDDSLALINQSISQGVSHMVATPHIRFGRFENNINSIQKAYDQLLPHIQDLPIKIKFAAEVHICPEIMILAQKKQLPFVGKHDGFDLLLLELPNDRIPPGTDNLIKWLYQQKIKVLIAHPERYKAFQKQDSLYQQYEKMGCLFQLTASCVLGDMGSNAKEFALHWLQHDRFFIVASDCHNLERRAPKMKKAFEFIKKEYGEQKAMDLFINHPQQISLSLFNE